MLYACFKAFRYGNCSAERKTMYVEPWHGVLVIPRTPRTHARRTSRQKRTETHRNTSRRRRDNSARCWYRNRWHGNTEKTVSMTVVHTGPRATRAPVTGPCSHASSLPDETNGRTVEDTGVAYRGYERCGINASGDSLRRRSHPFARAFRTVTPHGCAPAAAKVPYACVS